MSFLRSVSAKCLFDELELFGLEAPPEVPDIDLTPVSFNERRDLSIFFVADVGMLSDCQGLKNCVILGPDCDHISLENKTIYYIPTPDPRGRFFEILSGLFHRTESSQTVHPSAIIDPSAKIGNEVAIGPNVVIGPDCEIGDRSEIRPNVVIHGRVSIGKDCLVKSGTVIGQEGFGIYESGTGDRRLIPHLGGVKIGDRVLIGSLNTVCSGTLDPTSIGDDTKLDDHIHVAHNCIIGKNVTITACAELSGSVTIEDRVWIGPQAAILNKLKIGERAFIGLGAVVTKNVAPRSVVAGNPARVLRSVN